MFQKFLDKVLQDFSLAVDLASAVVIVSAAIGLPALLVYLLVVVPVLSKRWNKKRRNTSNS